MSKWRPKYGSTDLETGSLDCYAPLMSLLIDTTSTDFLAQDTVVFESHPDYRGFSLGDTVQHNSARKPWTGAVSVDRIPSRKPVGEAKITLSVLDRSSDVFKSLNISASASARFGMFAKGSIDLETHIERRTSEDTATLVFHGTFVFAPQSLSGEAIRPTLKAGAQDDVDKIRAAKRSRRGALIETFMDKWGTHFVNSIEHRLDVFVDYRMRRLTETDRADLSFAAGGELGIGVLTANARQALNALIDRKKAERSLEINIRTAGGVALDAVGEFLKESTDSIESLSAALGKFIKNIGPDAGWPWRIECRPILSMFGIPTETKSDVLDQQKDAILERLSKKMLDVAMASRVVDFSSLRPEVFGWTSMQMQSLLLSASSLARVALELEEMRDEVLSQQDVRTFIENDYRTRLSTIDTSDTTLLAGIALDGNRPTPASIVAAFFCSPSDSPGNNNSYNLSNSYTIDLSEGVIDLDLASALIDHGAPSSDTSPGGFFREADLTSALLGGGTVSGQFNYGTATIPEQYSGQNFNLINSYCRHRHTRLRIMLRSPLVAPGELEVVLEDTAARNEEWIREMLGKYPH